MEFDDTSDYEINTLHEVKWRHWLFCEGIDKIIKCQFDKS